MALALPEETRLMRHGQASEDAGQVVGRCCRVVAACGTEQSGFDGCRRRILALMRRPFLRLLLDARRLRGLRGLCITHSRAQTLQFGLGGHFLLIFGNLSMNRIRLRRSGAALLFPVHHCIGDSIRFLLVLVAGLALRRY